MRMQQMAELVNGAEESRWVDYRSFNINMSKRNTSAVGS